MAQLVNDSGGSTSTAAQKQAASDGLTKALNDNLAAKAAGPTSGSPAAANLANQNMGTSSSGVSKIGVDAAKGAAGAAPAPAYVDSSSGSTYAPTIDTSGILSMLQNTAPTGPSIATDATLQAALKDRVLGLVNAEIDPQVQTQTLAAQQALASYNQQYGQQKTDSATYDSTTDALYQRLAAGLANTGAAVQGNYDAAGHSVGSRDQSAISQIAQLFSGARSQSDSELDRLGIGHLGNVSNRITADGGLLGGLAIGDAGQHQATLQEQAANYSAMNRAYQGNTAQTSASDISTNDQKTRALLAALTGNYNNSKAASDLKLQQLQAQRGTDVDKTYSTLYQQELNNELTTNNNAMNQQLAAAKLAETAMYNTGQLTNASNANSNTAAHYANQDQLAQNNAQYSNALKVAQTIKASNPKAATGTAKGMTDANNYLGQQADDTTVAAFNDFLNQSAASGAGKEWANNSTVQATAANVGKITSMLTEYMNSSPQGIAFNNDQIAAAQQALRIYFGVN